MNQVEFLLRLSENAQEKGDDIARRHHDERVTHIKELQGLFQMIELARQNVWAELTRFGATHSEGGGLAAQGQQQRIPRVVAANTAQHTKEPSK